MAGSFTVNNMAVVHVFNATYSKNIAMFNAPVMNSSVLVSHFNFDSQPDIF